MEKIGKWFTKVILLIAIFFLVITSFFAIFLPPGQFKINDPLPILLDIFGVSLLLGMICLINLRMLFTSKRLKIFKSVATLISFSISLVLLITIIRSGYILDDDSWNIQVNIENNFFINGNSINTWNDQYFQIFPFQLGITYLALGLFEIFSNNYIFVFFFLNVISIATITYSAVSLTEKMFNRNAAFWSGIFSIIFIPIYFYTGIFYGDVIGTALSLISANLLIKIVENRHSIITIITFFVVTIFSYLAKPSMNLYIASITIFGIIYFLRSRRAVILISGIFLLILTTISGKALSDYQNKYFNVTKIENIEMPKTMWIAMGLQSGDYDYRTKNINYVTAAKKLDDKYPKPGTWNGFTFKSIFDKNDRNLTTQESSH